MGKVLDLGLSIHDICKIYPEVIGIMKDLGFDQITDPVSLNTVGRFMTIPKGSAMKKIKLEKIKKVFIENGFEILEREE